MLVKNKIDSEAMSGKYLEKTSKAIEKIIKEGSKGDSKTELVFHKFIRHFFQHVSSEYLSENDLGHLYASAKATWKFIQEKNLMCTEKSEFTIQI